jgi:hypothetical protein
MVVPSSGLCFAVLGTNISTDAAVANEPLAYNAGAYTGVIIDNGTGTGVADQHYNGEFASIQLQDGEVNTRLVSTGLRARYTGTNLNMGGVYTGLEEPDHRSLLGKGLSEVRAYDKAFSSPVDRNWFEVTYQPVTSEEYNFHNSSFANASGEHFMVICVTGTPGNTFDLEAWINVEYTGPQARGKSATPMYRQPTEKIVEALSYFSSAAISAVTKQFPENPARSVYQLYQMYQSIKGGTTQRAIKYGEF